MTLWRQVAIIIIVLLAAVFAGTFAISTHSIYRFLINQMNSHAQDTATSLGLAIGENLAAKDLITVNRMIDAIFDRGYYLKITLQDMTGKIIYNNEFSGDIENAPAWFAKLMAVKVEEKQAIVLGGWKNIGTIFVTSHPGYAYLELWRICQNNFWWFSGCIVTLLCGSLIVLSELLRPLKYVVEQAAAIAKENFIAQEKLPVIYEFKIVVEAMNKMAASLKAIFTKQVEFSALMRERAYKDIVTGLGNKRYFDVQLEQMLSSDETKISGSLLLVRLTEMGKYRSKWGYQLGDMLLRDLAALLTQLLDKYNIPVLCHFGNYEFALIVVNMEYNPAEQLTGKILQQINELTQHEFIKEPVVANIGCVVFTHDNFTADLLNKADSALRQSQTLGVNKIFIQQVERIKQAINIDNWVQFLQQVITKQAVFFNYQPVFYVENKAMALFHNEVLLRLKAPNQTLLASGIFMPMVEDFGLGLEFDKIVIELILQRIKSNQENNQQRYAINLSRAALLDAKFILWLSERCARAELNSPRLNFEIAEYLVRDNLAMVKELFACLRVYGIQVGLDHFGRGFSSFTYLQDLPLDYLKIDGSYTKNIETLVDNQMIIRSFVEVGHGLGLKVIASAIETEAERDMLLKLHVDGLQGYFIGQPV